MTKRLDTLAQRLLAATQGVMYCMDCDRPMRHEYDVFYICIGCQICWTLIEKGKVACGWTRGALPIA